MSDQPFGAAHRPVIEDRDGAARRAADRFTDLLGAFGATPPTWWGSAVLTVDAEPRDLTIDAVAPSIGLTPGTARCDERFSVRRAASTASTPETSDGAGNSWQFSAHSEEGLFRALVRTWLDPDAALQRGADGPRFSWRGLSLDVVRWPMPEDVLHAVIDLLALHGFTVLHLHLTDHQGWRAPVPADVEIPGRLDATAYARILEHAERRYLCVVPEIDLPGHTAALVAALPALASERTPLHPYLTYLDPRSPEVRERVRGIIAELAALTPGLYLHIGGDEAFSMPEDLYAQFMEFAAQCVREAGKLPIAWQEVARSGADVVAAQVWTSLADLPAPGSVVATLPPQFAEVGREVERSFEHAGHDAVALAARGIPAIVSEQDPYYLDRRYSGTPSDPAQAARLAEIGFPAYAPRSLEELWAFDPEAGETAAAEAAIVGVECAIWTETVQSPADLALLLLPRLALVGERAFRGGPAGDPAHARAMLRAARPAWSALGLGNAYREEDWT